jgi:hypothetical protein
MFRFTEDARQEIAEARAIEMRPTAPLTLSQIMARVERRLRWYGFSGWRIRDAVCLGADVTVLVRGPGGEILAFTVAREGGATTVAFQQPAALPEPVATPVRETVTPGIARTLGRRAMGALWGAGGRFLTRPALCEGQA